jgi:hypothetical protein
LHSEAIDPPPSAKRKKHQAQRSAGPSNTSSRRQKVETYDEYDVEDEVPTQSTRQSEKGMSKLPFPKVNTETFEPSFKPPTMRVVIDLDPSRMSVALQTRDLLYCPNIFKQPEDHNIYDRLVHEIHECRVPEAELLKSWHGDTHWIADDSTGWKKDCPVFTAVVDRLQRYFRMSCKATRFNWYKDTSEWKPYHFDAAAVKPDKRRTQNFTVGASFGATRVAAFEDAQTKTTVALPLPDGSVYCFARDTNILWRHGILPEKTPRSVGRISIILWGWIDQEEVD